MSAGPHELLRRPLYVYHLPAEVLETLTLNAGPDVAASPPPEADPQRPPPSRRGGSDASADPLVSAQACSLCRLEFSSLMEQRSHIRSDLHHYNLKQRLRGLEAVSEVEFESLIDALDESLSGSDSTDSDDEAGEAQDGQHHSLLSSLLKRQARLGTQGPASAESGSDRAPKPRWPIISFNSPLLPEKSHFCIYRAILSHQEQQESDFVAVLKQKQLSPIAAPQPPPKDAVLPPAAYKGPHIFLCMMGGGHFAAMVVSLAPRLTKGTMTMDREAVVLAHKTFHRYTTRRKQGGSQSANDNAKGNAHSAGSSLRRYNEQALVDDVRSLLKDWKALLDSSDLLFVRSTGKTNRRTLFGPYEGQVLNSKDDRLRSFPFSTRRATQKELMRSFIELTRLKIQKMDSPAVPTGEARPPEAKMTPAKKPASSKASKAKPSEEVEQALLHTSQLQALIRRSKLPAFLSYLSSHGLDAEFEFQPPDQNHHAPRPLHLAAAQSSPALVLGILTRAGANPMVRNSEGRCAFELAGDRSTRDAFRVARSELGEQRWAWDEAKVPAAISKAEAEGREARDKEERERKASERRRVEEERLRSEGPRVKAMATTSKSNSSLAAGLMKTSEERREEESRGLTAEMKMRLERERRARAAEERLRRMKKEEG